MPLEKNTSELTIDLLTIKDWIRWMSSEFERAEVFFGHGTDNAWDEAILLVLWVTRIPWQRLEEVWECRLSQTEKNRLMDAVRGRIDKRLPAAYLTGEAWFAGERYKVNENVLVPRSPIAELIAAEFQPWLVDYPVRILDMCTGSGCIGIVCAKQFLDAEVDLVDISPEALEVAEENIELHGVGDRVHCIQSDGLSQLEGQYDLIVSNPPYVSEEEYAALPNEYHVEPKLGLTSGDDGFDFVRRFLRDVKNYLSPQGLLVVEVGYDWEKFQTLYNEVPFFWPEFEHGGVGVFIISREELINHF